MASGNKFGKKQNEIVRSVLGFSNHRSGNMVL